MNCGGELVSNPYVADVYVSEAVDELVKEAIYVQPQYLFDCLNERGKIDIHISSERYFQKA